MRVLRLAAWIIAGVVWLAGAPVIRAAQDRGASGKEAVQAPEPIPSAACLSCHRKEGFAVEGPDGKRRPLHVSKDRFEKSVHGKRQCQECHRDITEIPHKPGVQHKVSCVQCHESLWENAKKENKIQEFARLGVVVEQIEKYMHSIHARPSREDQSRTNATCYNCHDAHYVYSKGSEARKEWRLEIPNACGKCHARER